MKPKGERYTIAVDFDGVIHSYTSPWTAPHEIPDPPVEGAIQWLLDMRKHFTIVIHTTRARTDLGIAAVQSWLFRNGASPDGIDWIVTDRKVAALVYIDDRAWRFEGLFPTVQKIHDARPWNKPRVK